MSCCMYYLFNMMYVNSVKYRVKTLNYVICFFLASLHVLHGFFKQHQVHVRVQLIVVLKSVHQGLLKLLQVSHLCVTRLNHTMSKMGVNQWLVDKNRLIYTLQRESKT